MDKIVLSNLSELCLNFIQILSRLFDRTQFRQFWIKIGQNWDKRHGQAFIHFFGFDSGCDPCPTGKKELVINIELFHKVSYIHTTNSFQYYFLIHSTNLFIVAAVLISYFIESSLFLFWLRICNQMKNCLFFLSSQLTI